MTSEFKQEVASSIEAQLWADASKFRNGKGAEAGVDLTVARRHLSSLRKKAVKKAGLLRAILTGAVWTRARIISAGGGCDELCPRCGMSVETDTHRFWEFPNNLEFQDIAEALARRGCSAAEERPILWPRGL
eukprot:9052739-Pyramimonas_sp.AAC.1